MNLDFISDPMFLILALETFLILLMVCGGLAYFILNRRRQDRRDASALVCVIKEGDAQRRTLLIQILRDLYKFEENVLPAKVDEFISHERTFYKRLIATYIQRDDPKLSQLPEFVEKLIAPVLKLVPHERIDHKKLITELKMLRRKNHLLRKELKKTRKQLDTLIDDFAVIFDNNVTRAEFGNTLETETTANEIKSPPVNVHPLHDKTHEQEYIEKLSDTLIASLDLSNLDFNIASKERQRREDEDSGPVEIIDITNLSDVKRLENTNV